MFKFPWCSFLFEICKFLPTFHQKLFHFDCSSCQLNSKKRFIFLIFCLSRCVRNFQVCFHNRSDSRPIWLRPFDFHRNRCLWLRFCWSSVSTWRSKCSALCGFLFEKTSSIRMQLWNLRQRTFNHNSLLQRMENRTQRFLSLDRCFFKPQKFEILHVDQTFQPSSNSLVEIFVQIRFQDHPPSRKIINQARHFHPTVPGLPRTQRRTPQTPEPNSSEKEKSCPRHCLNPSGSRWLLGPSLCLNKFNVPLVTVSLVTYERLFGESAEELEAP